MVRVMMRTPARCASSIHRSIQQLTLLLLYFFDDVLLTWSRQLICMTTLSLHRLLHHALARNARSTTHLCANLT